MTRRGPVGVTRAEGISIVLALALITSMVVLVADVNAVPKAGQSELTPATGGFGTVLKNIRVGEDPATPLFDSGNGNLYVANSESSNVTVISGSSNSVIANISVRPYPYTPVYDSSNGNLYVPCYSGSSASNSTNISVISGLTNRVITNITLPGHSAQAPTYDSANGDLYVITTPASSLSGPPPVGGPNVSVISGATNRVIATIPLGPFGSQSSVFYDGQNEDLYISTATNLSVISGSTNTVTATIPPPPESDWFYWGGILDNANGDLYWPVINLSTSPASFSLTVISGSTNAIVTSIPLPYGAEVGGSVYDAENGNLYVMRYSSNNLTVVSGATNTVITTLELPGGNAIAGPPVYDSGNGDLYVAMASFPGPPIWSQNVSVVSGSTNTVLGTIEVGYGPDPPTYDSSNGDLYVAEAPFTDNVTVIVTPSPTQGTTFLGLPTWEGYALVGGVVVAAVAIGGALLLVASRSKRHSGKVPPKNVEEPPSGEQSSGARP